MNKNIVCCIKCLNNNLFFCEFCTNYENYYKIRKNEEIIQFISKNKDNNDLSLYVDEYKLNKLLEEHKTEQFNIIGFDDKHKKILIEGSGYCNRNGYVNSAFIHFTKFKYKLIINYPKKMERISYINLSIYDYAQLPENLKEFVCKNTFVINFNNLPDNLLYLDCSDNQITQLDNLPFKLKYLDCSNNKITQLDYLNFNLEYLNCSNNNISFLDNLPNSIKYLYTDGNNIKSLLNLPENLLVLNSAKYTNINSRKRCIELLQKYNYAIINK